jgi:hypothetical protein
MSYPALTHRSDGFCLCRQTAKTSQFPGKVVRWPGHWGATIDGPYAMRKQIAVATAALISAAL